MKKAKKSSPKKSSHKIKARHQVGNHVYWYGVHIHHIALGVSTLGTAVLIALLLRR